MQRSLAEVGFIRWPGKMMLAHLGEEDAARIEAAVVKALESGKIASLSAGKMGTGTAEVGDLVASLV